MAILRVRKGLQPGAVFPVFAAGGPTVIGREGPIEVALGDAKASRRHAAISFAEGEWRLEDLQSSNGTILQGKRVETAVLKDGATIQIGGTLLSFHEKELLPLPAYEIHGARPLEALHEEAGVFVFRAHQAAMDREVRCDWLHPSRQLPEDAFGRIERAIEEAHKLSDPSIVPVIHAEAGREATFAILRGPVRPTLAEKMDDVLKLALPARIEVFRSLVDAALERATWEALRSPIAPCHAGIEISGPAAGAAPAVFLPALDLGALLAASLGSLGHLPHYAPYLPPELQEADDGAPRVNVPALASTMYNIGALGYHLLTGQKPMGEGDLRTVLENHRTVEPAPASLLDAGIPEGLSAMLAKMLAKDPRARPTGRQEVLAVFPAPAPRALPAAPPAIAPAPAQTLSIRTAAPLKPAPPRQLPAKPKAADPGRTPAAAPARDAPRKPAATAGKKSGVPALLYLPLWGIAWTALFVAARYLSKMVFHSLGG